MHTTKHDIYSIRRLKVMLTLVMSLTLFTISCTTNDTSSTSTTSTTDTTDATSPDATANDMSDEDMMDKDMNMTDKDTMGDNMNMSDDNMNMSDKDMMMYANNETLGYITVKPGEEIKVRSLEAIEGDVTLGIAHQRTTAMAIEDYGQIHGFDVDLGEGLNDTCGADGAIAAANIIVSEGDVVGVIGTSCSGAAVGAAPILSKANITMISASNTSASLTSDLLGNKGKDYVPGYYRTAHNDFFQGTAVANFLYHEKGVRRVATLHDGDPYTSGLVKAFTASFEELGGTITVGTSVDKEETAMQPVLTEIAASEPEALFFPLFTPAGNFVATQARDVPGLENITLMGGDGLIDIKFMEIEEATDVYLSGPDTNYDPDNTNQGTGQSISSVASRYEEKYGEPTASPFWAHAYDATVLLLHAIETASQTLPDGTLQISRAGVRAVLDDISEYKGLIGMLTCDDYGDCGASKITVIQTIGGKGTFEDSKANTVYTYSASS